MHDEERPSKLRKLSRDDQIDSGMHSIPTDPAVPRGTTPSDQSTSPTNHSKTSGELDPNLSQPYEQEDLAQENGLAEISKPPLSKNQQKKLKRRLEWDAGREQRKVWKKEKLAQRKERIRNERESSGLDKASATGDGPRASSTDGASIVTKGQARLRSKKLPISFVIDCGFDDLMTEKERISLGAQLARSYSENRRSPFRADLVVSSFGGHLKERFETVLANHHQSWNDVVFTDADFVQGAEQARVTMEARRAGWQGAGALADGPEGQGEVVYLSSESPDTLTRLSPFSTYIIGGLVDKNRHKGICYKRALDRGIKTARLPIGEYLQMSSRHVLTTNHVVEIMLKWLESGDWADAFLQVMPKRKGGELKTPDGVVSEEQVEGPALRSSKEVSGREKGEFEKEEELDGDTLN